MASPNTRTAPGGLEWAAPKFIWPALVAVMAIVPFARGLTGANVFYVRDLTIAFWGRYLWLRRAWLSGEWPLWDPYVGGGQAAYSDALNQIFLLPSVMVRLIGGEVLGFNLWVALPFPLAALGGYLFFARRFSASAAALGALAFVLCGPIVSTGNFPNLSWTVAALPWVLWATDGAVTHPSRRRLAALAIAVALQALAGEPLTQFATLVLAVGYALTVGGISAGHGVRDGLRHAGRVVVGLGLGVALAAIQLIPVAQAAAGAKRSESVHPDMWSLRPTALLESVWFHLFGDYSRAQFLAELPWMPLIYMGREPLLISVYLGVPIVALSAFGLAGCGLRRWRLYWVTAGLVSLIAAFGAYTPIYPIFRDNVPLIGSLRFPVKYLIVTALAVAAGVAAGWDTLAGCPGGASDARRSRRARRVGAGVAIAIGGGAALAAAACLFLPGVVGPPLAAFAVAMGAPGGGPASAFMVRTVPFGAVKVVMLSLLAVVLLLIGMSGRAGSRAARFGLFALILGDLLVAAWAINPVLDAQYLAEPRWISQTKADSSARVYVGGKQAGTLDAGDLDASRAFLNPPGLTGAASRAALTIQAAYYPSAWRTREMLSFDLAALWPHVYETTSERFRRSRRERRDSFLDRTGVRYRILPARQATGRTPIMPIPYFLESFLYDWGPDVMPRAAVVASARVVPEINDQVEALFAPGWDSRTTAIVQRKPDVAGKTGDPVSPFARIVVDSSNRVVIDAGAQAGGGYLVLLDTHSPDWRASVDGRQADMVLANGLFRAVRLAPGRHVVEFVYRPTALVWGLVVSSIALMVTAWLLMWPRRPRQQVAGA